MSWPDELVTMFNHAHAKNTLHESYYYGPCNKLLSYCFASFKFYVTLQSPSKDGSLEKINFAIFLITSHSSNVPVLIVEIKDDSQLEDAESLYSAGQQICSRFLVMFNKHLLPRLWGISLIGMSACIYRANTAKKQVNPLSRPCPTLHMFCC
ncbi:hypothetical protein DFP72DRAFT_832045 [Ephemerocybe angulata]|uniref:Uncharacterized protein n=1 Tax=Ephemerocybe angulata TaxID=980116 RepID=A0A8H6H949_9AGAR|nr:hypothetical protein DFP72DRAFT_832045 [Tulosesus angulatus]